MIQGVRGLSYEERLERTGLTTLEVRRERGDLIEVYKILKEFEDIEGKSLFKLADTAHNTRGHSLKLAKSRSRLDIRKYLFSQRVIELWNSLPPHAVFASSVLEFKKVLGRCAVLEGRATMGY